jgi:hypothetical protein
VVRREPARTPWPLGYFQLGWVTPVRLVFGGALRATGRCAPHAEPGAHDRTALLQVAEAVEHEDLPRWGHSLLMA